MGAIEDVRNLLQDIVSPDIKAIKARLDALENTVARNHGEVMSAINRITDYAQVMQRLAALEAKQQPPN
jgi:tetrahydromethanopterin S-methyltransferase subunit G